MAGQKKKPDKRRRECLSGCHGMRCLVPAHLLNSRGRAFCCAFHVFAQAHTNQAHDAQAFLENGLPSNCPSLHQFCRNAKNLSDGFHVHAAAMELYFKSFIVLDSHLVHIYADHGALSDARCVLSAMPFRDKFAWSHMINGYGLRGHAYEAFQCFDHMQMEGVLPDMFVYASILSGCATLLSLHKGQQLHSIIVNSGVTLDAVTGTALVNMYGKCGCLSDALTAFHSIHEHDTVSWNAIIANHAQHEKVQEALELLLVMQAQGVSPNTVTFTGILPAFGNPIVLIHGKEVHNFAVIYGFELDVNLANAMISMYGKCGSLDDARALFQSVPGKNSLSWTVMVQSAVLNGHTSEAFILYKQMQSEGAIPDALIHAVLLCVTGDQGNLAQGRILHALMLPSLGQGDVELENVILNMYNKCGNIEMARAVFDAMVDRNVASWNAMLSAYVQHNLNQAAISLFSHLQTCKFVPDKVSFLSILSALSQELGPENEKASILVKGMGIHSLVLCHGLDADMELGNTLVLMYARHRACKEAQCVFDGLVARSSVSWNVCIIEKVQKTGPIQTFSQMLEEGVMPCVGTFVSLLSACDNVFLLKVGKTTHARMATSTSGMDMVMGNRLIDMYCRCGSIGCAQQLVFDFMLERNHITWTQMIDAYTNSGQSEAALKLFDHMQGEGLVADRITYTCILSACACGIAIAKGKTLHACISGSDLACDVAVGNALLNMYGKCGNMKDADTVFSQMPLTDKVSWSSMITNYAQHGHNNDALQVFKEMKRRQVLPDNITCISVLRACSHTGQIAEGFHWFHNMQEDFEMQPTLDHYNCILDLLGRAGMLSQAEDMVRDMNCAPNMITWMTLLGACRFHVDVERGKRFAERLFKLNPSYLAPYVILSNICFAAGLEEQATRIITRMREGNLGRGGFYGLTESNDKVCEFLDEDCEIWQNEVVYAEL